MTGSSRLSRIAIASMALTIAGPAAWADVEEGVVAWSHGNYEAAAKYWREPAVKGDANAQFNLGQAYKMGRGVKADPVVALDWFKRAAAQGHLQAADSYGYLLHQQGKITESLPYLQSSVERGDPRAQYLLGTELFNGVYIQKNWVQAYTLMMRASSAGMPSAQRSLAQMDQYIPLEQRQAATILAGESEISMKATPVNVTRVAPQIPPGQPAVIAAVGEPAAKTRIFQSATVKPAPENAATTSNDLWRIQLGAFGNEANAQKLWKSLETKISGLSPLQHYLMATGPLTRLQAGPFDSREMAKAMCNKLKAAGHACLVVPV